MAMDTLPVHIIPPTGVRQHNQADVSYGAQIHKLCNWVHLHVSIVDDKAVQLQTSTVSSESVVTPFHFVFPLGHPRAPCPAAPRHPLWYVVCRPPLGCGVRGPASVAVLLAANRKLFIDVE